jgi:hypothetical protein
MPFEGLDVLKLLARAGCLLSMMFILRTAVWLIIHTPANIRLRSTPCR